MIFPRARWFHRPAADPSIAMALLAPSRVAHAVGAHVRSPDLREHPRVLARFLPELRRPPFTPSRVADEAVEGDLVIRVRAQHAPHLLACLAQPKRRSWLGERVDLKALLEIGRQVLAYELVHRLPK